ncbi:hypothetical protein J7M00_01965, partial [bacterium]|nr:hypothetical protein [bacterium]
LQALRDCDKSLLAVAHIIVCLSAFEISSLKNKKYCLRLDLQALRDRVKSLPAVESVPLLNI